MSAVVKVAIHESQFPEQVRRDLLQSLAARRVNHKFHYDSLKQTQKWLVLHQAYSPSRTDPDCAATYDRSFGEALQRLPAQFVHLIGLGCGGGQKDVRLLRLLVAAGKKAVYTPSDVSTAMVLVASRAAAEVIGPENCLPLVCDLASMDDLAATIDKQQVRADARLITFFGMIPNFEPELILLKLAGLLRAKDWLLFSANLAPGQDYIAGIQRILPSYDNPLTRDWLLTFLLDLGAEPEDGNLEFLVEEGPGHSGLRRVAADFRFARARKVVVEDQEFRFTAGESIRLFFSYRYTPELIRALLLVHGLEVTEQWITTSGEEGVFLVKKLSASPGPP